MTTTADARIAEIEGLLDRFYTGGYKKTFAIADYLRLTECTATHSEQIAGYYRPLLEEALELAAGDPEVAEAYGHLRKPQINKFVEQIQSIVDDAERHAEQLRESRPRKTRARKEKSAEQLTKDFAFLRYDENLQLCSHPPTMIVGAQAAYLFNVKYKTLQVLLADEAGLTVRGSTVHGFSDKSFTKTVRRPDDVIPTIVGTGWKSALDAAASLRTKTQRPTGRSNKDTVIVKVVRSG